MVRAGHHNTPCYNTPLTRNLHSDGEIGCKPGPSFSAGLGCPLSRPILGSAAPGGDFGEDSPHQSQPLVSRHFEFHTSLAVCGGA